MADTTTKRHPIRGFLYGIMFGLGLALTAIGQKWVALGTWPPFILFIVGLVVGTAWATFAPAKKPKGPAPDAAPEPPAEPEPPTEAEPEAPTEAQPEPDPEPVPLSAEAPATGDYGAPDEPREGDDTLA